jgi:predicted CoA-binding protein
MNVTDSEIKDILVKYKKLTVYGLSKDENKPSQYVPVYMASKGYDIIGIYPTEKQIAGFPIFQSLSQIPKEHLRFVDVFQKSERIPAIVDEVIALGGVEVLWLQLGITHPEAEKKAAAAGIKVISNRCLKVEYARYF